MPECYVEILQESRSIDADRTSTSQTIVIQFQLDAEASPSAPRAMFLGDNDDVLALETAYSIFPAGRWLPNSFGDEILLIISSVKVEQVNNLGWWKATADYIFDSNTGEGGERGEDPTAPTLPFIKVGFSVGNRTRTVTQSLAVLQRNAIAAMGNRPLPSTAMGNVIGYSEDNITGAEVYSGGLNLQVTAYYFPQFITFNFLNMLAQMTSPQCSTNSDDFLGYSPGEVLLLGADGSATITDVVPITYTFEIKKNVSAQPDPPFAALTCPGHSVIDYRYVKSLDGDAQLMIQVPTYRIVHRVYQERPFAVLGFPTS